MDVRDKIGKLLSVHRSVPNTPEGKNALKRAKHLMTKHGLTEADFRPKPQPPSQPRVGQPSGVDPITVLIGGARKGPVRSFDEELGDVVQGLKDLFRR